MPASPKLAAELGTERVKPTNKTLLSLSKPQIPLVQSDEGETAPHAVPEITTPTVQPIAPTLADTPLSSPASVTAATPAPQPNLVVPVSQPLPTRASNKMVGALICTGLALVASLVFIARLLLASLPLVANGLQPLAEIGVAAIDQPEPAYAMDLAFPLRETAIPPPVAPPSQNPAKLKIGVYQQADNVEKWRRWARQQKRYL